VAIEVVRRDQILQRDGHELVKAAGLGRTEHGEAPDENTQAGRLLRQAEVALSSASSRLSQCRPEALAKGGQALDRLVAIDETDVARRHLLAPGGHGGGGHLLRGQGS
jgi:hypothetical protein